MIHLSSVTKAFSSNVIIDHCSFVLPSRAVVGLIGDNGSGKSTLLSLINGSLVPESGSIEKDHETIGYLPQKFFVEPCVSIEQVLKRKNPTAKTYEMKKILHHIGLQDVDLLSHFESLSEGQKTKVYLASILLQTPKPTMLLLDEPTNNLDMDGIEWIESWIQTWPGSVFLVSHDRALLDTVCENILLLENGTVTQYGGNYSSFVEKREIERKAQERLYTVQQKRIKRIEENIFETEKRAKMGELEFGSDNPYQRRKISKGARQAVYRKRKLEKYLNGVDIVEKPKHPLHYHITIASSTFSGKPIVSIKSISKNYGAKKVLEEFSLYVGGKDRIWLQGKNGSGKTTLLNILSGQIQADAGDVSWGTNISVGYFSQNRQGLMGDSTIIDEFMKMGLSKTECIKLALSFGIEPEKTIQPIESFSVGEQAKVAFAKLTHGNHQLLILDEPTNHLEIQTREIIEGALRAYQGALIVASHDRYFINAIDINRIIPLSLR